MNTLVVSFTNLIHLHSFDERIPMHSGLRPKQRTSYYNLPFSVEYLSGISCGYQHFVSEEQWFKSLCNKSPGLENQRFHG